MAATLSTISQILQKMYIPRFRDQLYGASPFLDRFQKRNTAEHFEGSEGVMALRYQRSQAVGARAEGAALPTAQNSSAIQVTFDMAFLYATLKLSGQVMAQARTNRHAFVRAIELEMSGIKESVRQDMSRQVLRGDGTGKLATTVGTGSGATSLVVDDVTFLKVGMVIDVYTSGGSQELNSITITAINTSTKTLTIASSTWSNGSYVYREDSRNAEMQGIAAACDDATLVTTYMGISRSTYPWWSANALRNGGTNRPLTTRLMDDALLERDKNGPGGYPDIIVSKHVIAQTYADMMVQQRNYRPEMTTIEGGWTAMKINSMSGKPTPWLIDRFAPANTMYLLDMGRFFHYESAPWGFIAFQEDASGDNVFHPALDGTDAYEARMRTYGEVVTDQCNSHTLLADLLES